MSGDVAPQESDFLFYSGPDSELRIEVLSADETIRKFRIVQKEGDRDVEREMTQQLKEVAVIEESSATAKIGFGHVLILSNSRELKYNWSHRMTGRKNLMKEARRSAVTYPK